MKIKTQFVCQSCGNMEAKWFGRCSACDSWNSAVEERVEPGARKSSKKKMLEPKAAPIRDIQQEELPRIKSGLSEFDRVLGGGLVPGSVTLLGGEPGIGKSTLLIQAIGQIAENAGVALYISGEESVAQVQMRAQRLGINPNELYLLSENHTGTMVDEIEHLKPYVVVVDSIQSAYRDELSSAPGTVSQIRECSSLLLQVAKKSQGALILVGHVTKDGTLAGPRVLEHMVDTVLQLEGDRHGSFRVLRAVKNRFGSTNELGLFEMQERGLREVSNPSANFLGSGEDHSPGTAITVSLEGTRPLLLEVQALTCPSSGFGAPRRNTAGVEPQRMAMLLAVLEKRIGIPLGSQDVYLNLAGGVRISETAIDLGVCLAVASGYYSETLDHKTVVFGEVGLSGEIRSVRGVDRRLSEATNLGFIRCLLPQSCLREIRASDYPDLELVGIKQLNEALEYFALGDGSV